MNNKIRYIVIDVDGTLTDAGIYYDECENELKKFCTRDGVGFLVAHYLDIKLIVLTGRECAATTRRMKEMKIDYIFQDVHNKHDFLKKIMEENGIQKDELAYIGDDINDLYAMSLAGFIGCPADGCQQVKKRADYISSIKGGCGVFRDVMEYIVGNEKWEKAVKEIYEKFQI